MAWMQQQKLNLEGGELHCRYYPLSSRLELEWQGQQCFCQRLYGLPRRQIIVLNGQDYRLEIISLPLWRAELIAADGSSWPLLPDRRRRGLIRWGYSLSLAALRLGAKILS
ncbi:hypothetical protein ACRTDJ_12625 [Shewanella algae]|uniref:hypothetical protein n=1 Tax=Shewanella carassii TaxID=1987584 RepID=UPI001BEF2AD8|nr:hypothetical protein [Shewanella carassii]BCV68282.1 hypothetical protein TUM17387_36410 [Shewanella carassii]